MRLEKVITLCFFFAMGGMFPVFAGIIFDSDCFFRIGMAWSLACGFAMFTFIVYDVVRK